MQNVGSRQYRFLLLYGSQTGQAQAIAEEFQERACALGLVPDLQCMKGADSRYSLEREKLAVIVISTTGDGEAPDTARKLIRRLNKRTLGKDYLKQLNYALLALGDSNYLNFCNCGKLFDKRLRELGAKPFQDTCCADDAVGLEVAVEPWIEQTLQFLLKYFHIDSKTCLVDMSGISPASDMNATLAYSSSLDGIDLNLPPLPPSYLQVEFKTQEEVSLNTVPYQNNLAFPFSASDIFTVSLCDAKILTNSPNVKEYLQLTFQLPRDSVKYHPGDAFGFLPRNDFSEVQTILKFLGVVDKANLQCYISSKEKNHNIPSHLPNNATLHHLFSTCCDIRSPPKKTLLRTMAEYATGNEKRRLLELCSRQGSNQFTNLIRGKHLSILDLLKAFPTCWSIPVEIFLQNLPRLQARYYSVANSPLIDCSKFTIVFSVVKFNVEFGKSNNDAGVCTGHLKEISNSLLDKGGAIETDPLISAMESLNIKASDSIKVFKRKTSSFTLPEDHSIPLIMIGPGAGVAPFLGFLEHREQLLKIKNVRDLNEFGESWLYFGCRHKEQDFIFEKEIKHLKSCHILTKLRISFSRDPDSSSKYVQHNIQNDFPLLLGLLEEKQAVVFVCGDAKNIGKDVANTFIQCYQSAKNVSPKEALQWHTDLQKNKRYVQDLWL